MPARERWSEIHFLDSFLAAVHAHVRQQSAICAGAWSLAGSLLALAGLLAADAATDFAAYCRATAYCLAALAAVGIVSGTTWAAWTQRPSPLYLARLVEGGRPELKNALLTYVELRCAAEPDPWACAAVGRRAARILAGADPAEFAPAGSLRPAALAATASACILGATLWLAQGILFRHWTAAAEAGPFRPPSTANLPRAADPGRKDKHGAEASAILGAPPAARQADREAPEAEPVAHASGAAAASDDLAAAIAADRNLVADLLADHEKLLRLAEALAAPQRPDRRGADLTPDPAGAVSPDASSAAGTAGPGGPTGAQNTAGPPGSRAAATIPRRREITDAQVAAHAFAREGTAPAGQAVLAQSDVREGNGRGTLPPPTAAADEGDTRSPRAPAAAGNVPAPPLPSAQDARRIPLAVPGSGLPLPQLPQSTAFSEKTLDALRQVKRLIEAADERLRTGEADEEFLGRIGMTDAEFRRFVAAWQRKLETAAPEDVLPRLAARRATELPQKGEVFAGGAGADARPIILAPADAAPTPADPPAGPTGQVSARLRPRVAAYFQALGRAAADHDAGEPPE